MGYGQNPLRTEIGGIPGIGNRFKSEERIKEKEEPGQNIQSATQKDQKANNVSGPSMRSPIQHVSP